MHVGDASVDNDQLYINVQDCWQTMFIPHHQWLDEHTALARANEQLNRAENQQCEDWEEISCLQSCITALKDELSSVKANLFASIAKKAMDRPLMGVPARPLSQPGTGPSSSSWGSVQSSTLSKPKMSGHPKLEPYTEDIPMGAVPKPTTKDAPMTAASEGWVDPYLEALGSDDEEWDDFEEEAQAEMVKATTSRTAQIVQSILNGSYQNPTFVILRNCLFSVAILIYLFM
jgi:hypothetical protein